MKVLGLLSALVLAAVAGATGAPATPAPPQQSRQPDSEPVWSPDGKTVAFRRPTGVLAINSQGGRARTLVRRGSVTWLRNGKLGVSSSSLSSLPAVSIMNADGSGRRFITRGESPVWSPDGRKVVVSRYFQARNTTKLFIVDVRTARERSIPGPRCRCAWDDDALAWSPDSRRLVFTRFINASPSHQSFGLHVAKADGTHLRRIADEEIEAVTWSPRGDRVAGTSWDDVGRVLWVISVADGSKTRVGRGATPSWSPSGELLAFRGADGAYVSRVDGTGLKRLAGPTGPTCPPEISPCKAPQWLRDGASLLWASGTNLVVSSADGRNGRAVASGAGAVWSPNSDRIAFAALRCGADQGVFVTQTDGSDLVRLSRHCSISGTELRERITGTPADDTIYARDKKRDRVDCGDGRDRVFADPADVIRNCEIILRR